MRYLITIVLVSVALIFAAPVRQSRAQAAHDHAEAGHDHAAEGHDHAAEGHEHPTEGPHGGPLMELGEEEYHAELVLDEEHDQITIVLLDSKAKEEVAIETPFLRINVKTADKPRQYKLAPLYPESQQPGVQPQGPTSMYSLVSPELMEDLHSEEVSVKLSLKIGKKTYTTPVAHEHHDHEHAGHDHTEHEHEPALVQPQ